MFKSLNLRLRPGLPYAGPACYTDDYSAVPKPGYYALSADGKRLLRPLVRLVCVDDAPGDSSDGACHYEVARKRDPVQRSAPNVPLEARAVGKTQVRQ